MVKMSADDIKRVIRAAKENFPEKGLEDYTEEDFQKLAESLMEMDAGRNLPRG
jgi:hypothetical protein